MTRSNAIKRRSRPYAVDLGRVPSASPQAAVATAAHDVLVPALRQLPAPPAAGIPAAVAQVDSAYTAALAELPDGKRKRQGVSLGRAAAAAINAMRAGDGADTPFFDYTPITNPAPGDFQWVAGADFQVVTNWGDVTPFVMTSGDQLRPPPPHALTSVQYAADFNELKELGSLTSTTRTRTQTEIALFWYESSPMRWNRIARTVSASRPPRDVGQRPAVRPAQRRRGRRLHRQLGGEAVLQPLAPGDGGPPRRHRRQSR